jgi:hypothetical protein
MKKKCRCLWNFIRLWHNNGYDYWEFYCQWCLAIRVVSNDKGKDIRRQLI